MRFVIVKDIFKRASVLHYLLPMLLIVGGVLTSQRLNAQSFADSSQMLHPLNNGFEWGTSAADFNNDGWVDIYHEDRLYLNRGKEGFVDILAETGINQGSSIFGAVFGDYNNDGYLDILFEDFGPPSKLYRNDNRLDFTHVNAQTGLNVIGLTQGAAWADYNKDGTLDLYANEDTGDNQLFENNSHSDFTEVTVPSGVVTQGNSYGTSWGDFNNDGFPDIFIATCNSSPFNSIKHLLRNNGDGSFTDINYDAGVADSLASWGITWVDFDNDGYWDIYIGNSVNNPRPGHNKLYHNNRDETFSDRSISADVQGNSNESTYGVAAADFDNDGWIDLYVANSNANHRLYRNNKDGTFTDVAASAGITEDGHRAVAVADYNNDGWMDIFTAGGPDNRLMINEKNGLNNWIKVNLRGTTENYYGVGARIEVYTGDHFQMREIRAGDSFCSQNDLLSAHFGLGTAVLIDSIVVKWQAGVVDVLENVNVNRHITIAEEVGLVNPPMSIFLKSPANQEVVRALSSIELDWTNATADAGEETILPVAYKLHIWGGSLDTIITDINVDNYMIDAALLEDGQTYRWMVEGGDGYSIFASHEINSFTYDRDVFERVAGASIVNDDGYSEGGAWADYNNDGFPDLFVGNIISQDNLLFDSDGDGTFTQVNSGAVVNDGGFSYGGHFIDYDEDGDLDLYVINRGQSGGEANFLYDNIDGNFVKNETNIIAADVGSSWSGAWADYDNDGLVDLFVSNFNEENFLYQNNGSGVFTKITTGDVVTGSNSSLGSAWGDYDGDGDVDLFVATIDPSFTGVSSPNNLLYRNNGDSTFTEITDLAPVMDGGNSVGASWGDYDNDGDLDLFVTNYFGEDNFLYRNDDGVFQRITEGAAVTDGGLSVGSNWGDYDNDGDLDLIVSDDGAENRLYENVGDGLFNKVENMNVVTDVSRSNGINWIDVDMDGDLDLFVTNGDNSPQSNFLYKNELTDVNYHLAIHLVGDASNIGGIGAKVRVKSDLNGTPTWQMRELTTQHGYNSQNGYVLNFGLGNSFTVDSIVVEWPSGKIQSLVQQAGNRMISIVEDSTAVVGLIGNSRIPEAYELMPNYPNPFNPETQIQYALPEAAEVRLRIFNVLGQEVKVLVATYQEAGIQEVSWDGRNDRNEMVPSGIYFYRLEANGFAQSRKMILLR